MVDNEHFASMDVNALAAECSSETKKYFRKLAYEARYCFELLCRACRDQYNAALNHIYAIYLPILAARARRHRLFEQSSQDTNSFAHIAFSNFYHAVKGENFLKKFGTLEQVIAYMHACVHTVILEDVKSDPLTDISDDEGIPSPEQPSELDFQELWTQICSDLTNEDDQLLAHRRLVLDMKPAEIAQLYPQKWATAREASVALQRIRRILRKNRYLRGLAGLTNEADDQPDESE